VPAGSAARARRRPPWARAALARLARGRASDGPRADRRRGSGKRSRLHSTSRVLARVGATPGPVFGRLTDRALYAAILAQDVALALDLVDELAVTLVRDGVDYVVADALEGYNPAHDLSHVLVSAAVARAARGGHRVAHFDLPLVGRPDTGPSGQRSVTLPLDDAALARKLLAAHGVEAFGVECLRPLTSGTLHAVPPEDLPYYERYGAGRVAAGRYARVLRYREHFAPLAAAVRRSVLVEEPWTASAS